MSIRQICVVGLGYIGLPTAALFASNGVKVHGVDLNKDVINCINQGKIHIVEPNLEQLVAKAVKDKTLSASSKAIISDAFIISVPTPLIRDNSKKESKPKPDLSFVKAAVSSIASVLKKGDLIILESTSPIGTSEKNFRVVVTLSS
jgi:UDP-N-acetyl-D-mannosaminuronic acid dehydrogenase